MVEKIALHDAGRRRPGCLPAMPGQADQGIGCRQPVEITTRQPGPGGEFGRHRQKGRHAAGGRNPLADIPGKPLDLAQAEANASRREGAVPITGRRIRRQHGNAVPAGILDQLGRPNRSPSAGR